LHEWATAQDHHADDQHHGGQDLADQRHRMVVQALAEEYDAEQAGHQRIHDGQARLGSGQ
jgi:hypothetical protein